MEGKPRPVSKKSNEESSPASRRIAAIKGFLMVVGIAIVVPLVVVKGLNGTLRFGGFSDSDDSLPPVPSASPLPSISRVDCSIGGGTVPIPGRAEILESPKDPSGPILQILNANETPVVMSESEGDNTRLDALSGSPGGYNISTGRLLVRLVVDAAAAHYYCSPDAVATPARVGSNTNLG